MTGKSFPLSFAGWWVVWILVQLFLLDYYGTSLIQNITDSLICNLLLAASCLIITNNMKYYLPKKERYWYLLIMSLVLSWLWLMAIKTILKLIFKHEEDYLVMLGQSTYIRFVYGFLMTGCMAMISLLWYTLQEQQETSQRKDAAEQMTKDAELLKLRQQLQPHFLFNSLNSISALAGSQPEKARLMIQQLSDFLRGTLKREELQKVSLAEEMHHLYLYLEIEKVRFGHRLQTQINLGDDTQQLFIPSLLLQPIVENAIKFGLYDTIGEVNITLDAVKQEDNLFITISNPYDPETACKTQGTGFGLASIQRRLFLLFARHDLLKTCEIENRFITQLTIPQYHYESTNH